MPDVFQILADPTRRRLVEVLQTGEHSVSELVDVVDIGQPGVSRQLAILQKARFVVVRPEPFQELNDWIMGYRAMWEARLDRFAAQLDRRRRTRPKHKEERK